MRTTGIAVGLAMLLAALSLLLPYVPVYDPWGWLVWGDELARLDLSTAAGPSWKPLPVFVGVPLSLLGSAAPHAWLLVARAGALMAPLLAGLLAARLGGAELGRWRLLAAALAAGSVALTGDAFTPPTRQFTGGLSEPLLVTLVLAAGLAALDRRPATALRLGVAASLLRPECWPFLLLWALWTVRAEPRLRWHALAAAAVIPLAWFVPDLLAAGNPLEGSETARNGAIELVEVAEVLGRALAAPLAAIWIGVAYFVLASRLARDGVGRLGGLAGADRVAAVLLLGAAAWIGLVGAMAVVGFAGLPRFFAPASAAISVVGGVGLARGAAASLGTAKRSPLAALTAAALILAAAGFGLRVAQVPGDLETVRAQGRSIDQLFELADRIGPDRLLVCGGRVRVTQLLAQTALAWKLDEPIESVKVIRRPRFGTALSTRPLPGKVLGEVGIWRATRLPCPAAQMASGPAMAGVSGATR